MKKTCRYLALFVFSAALLVGGLYGWIAITGNVHLVIPSKIWRSAQLNPQQLRQFVSQHRIRSILDLDPGNTLHKQELIFSNQHHINHIDLHLNVHGACSKANLLKLIGIINNAPKPLLLHCRQGIDRTGLASAIAAIIYSQDPTLALKQISFRYANVWPTSVGKQTIPRYFHWAKEHNLTIRKGSLLEWVNSLPA